MVPDCRLWRHAGETGFRILGALSIPLLFLLARRFTDSATSLVAALLLAVSQIGVYFSRQEARPYVQAQFLSLLAALAFLWFLQKPGFRRSMAFGAASTALLFTHYYGAGTLLALGVYWLIFRRDYSPLALRWLATIVVLLAVTYVPWILALQSAGRLNQERLIRTGAPSSERPNLFSPIGALNRFNNAKFESIEAPTSLPQALLGLAVFTFPAAGALWYTWRRGPQGVVLGYLLRRFLLVWPSCSVLSGSYSTTGTSRSLFRGTISRSQSAGGSAFGTQRHV